MNDQSMQHRWVKHTITHVDTLPDPENDDEIYVIESQEDRERAEEEAVYGCDRCGLPMAGNTDTLCKGAPSGTHTQED